MPQERPPPPHGTSTVSTSGRSSRISRPIVPLPAMTAASADRVDEEAFDAGIAHAPPGPATSARVRDLHDAGAEPLDRRELGRPERCPARRRCRGCRFAARSRRRPAPCCRRSPSRRRERAPRRRRDAIAFRGAADLEGADRLEALELEEDLARTCPRRVGSERSPESRSGDPGARGADRRRGRGRSIGVVAASSELHELPDSRARAPSSRCAAPRRRPRSRGPRT